MSKEKFAIHFVHTRYYITLVEENLNKFATLAYSKILKKQKGLNGVPWELFSIEMNSDESFEKRLRSKTKKMQESEEQENTLSPKRKRRKIMEKWKVSRKTKM